MRRTTAILSLFPAILASCTGDLDGGGEEETGAIRASPPFDGDPEHDAVFAVDVSMWEGPLAPRELDCFWESGVRHVIAGTQVEEVTRQQLEVSLARGMSVDAYVYLYWDGDVPSQVERAFARVEGLPIGAMWLDVEDTGGAGGGVIAQVEAGLATCRAHGLPCGIYTGPGFWKTWLGDTPRLADAPLWYARYNGRRTLGDWSSERFGGWSEPTGKQWAEEPLCGVGVVKDTIRVLGPPPPAIDRSLPPAPIAPPAPPALLYPAEGARVGVDYVKLIADTTPHAIRYQLALERWTGTRFASFATWTSVEPFKKTFPARNATYRWRARAENAHGWGAWSAYATFGFGQAASAPSGEPEPPAPPAPSGGLSPDGVTLSGDRVTLSAAPLAGADRYELAIEVRAGDAFSPYVTYPVSAPEKSFYPQVRGTTYRWRIHGRVGGAWSEWSGWATFNFE